MKLSVPQWLSVAIVLPLITAILNPIAPAHANNSDRINPIGSYQTKPELTNPNQLLARITNPEPNKVKFKKHKNKFKSKKKAKSSHFQFRLSRSSGRTYLRLVSSPHRRTNKVGNPIYRLEAYVNGQPYRTFKAVTGTAYTQNKNRHRANSAAPLPDGSYQVSRQVVRGKMAEVGRTFVPIYPRFKTSRNDLGVHLDPSYNKRNGHDGTAGCIGLTSGRDRDAFNRYVKKFQPRTLIVRIL
jgi:hypothetical protein